MRCCLRLNLLKMPRHHNLTVWISTNQTGLAEVVTGYLGASIHATPSLNQTLDTPLTIILKF